MFIWKMPDNYHDLRTCTSISIPGLWQQNYILCSETFPAKKAALGFVCANKLVFSTEESGTSVRGGDLSVSLLKGMFGFGKGCQIIFLGIS